MNTRKITEGALLLAVFTIILLMSLYLPLLGTMASFALPIPFIYYTAKYNWKYGLFLFLGSLGISIIVGSIFALPVVVVYGLTGIVIGWFIYGKKDRTALFIGATLTFLLNVVIQFAISVIFLEINVFEEILQVINKSIEITTTTLNAFEQNINEEVFDLLHQFSDLLIVLLPSLLVIASLISVFIIQMIAFPIIKKFGIEVPNAKPFHELSLPKSLIWYYLVILLISIFVPIEEKTFLYSVITNFLFILQMAMIFQGITFVFFYFHHLNTSKTTPIIITIVCFLFPIFLQILRILGIIDLGFDLRSRLSKRQ